VPYLQECARWTQNPTETEKFSPLLELAKIVHHQVLEVNLEKKVNVEDEHRRADMLAMLIKDLVKCPALGKEAKKFRNEYLNVTQRFFLSKPDVPTPVPAADDAEGWREYNEEAQRLKDLHRRKEKINVVFIAKLHISGLLPATIIEAVVKSLFQPSQRDYEYQLEDICILLETLLKANKIPSMLNNVLTNLRANSHNCSKRLQFRLDDLYKTAYKCETACTTAAAGAIEA